MRCFGSTHLWGAQPSTSGTCHRNCKTRFHQSVFATYPIRSSSSGGHTREEWQANRRIRSFALHISRAPCSGRRLPVIRGNLCQQLYKLAVMGEVHSPTVPEDRTLADACLYYAVILLKEWFTLPIAEEPLLKKHSCMPTQGFMKPCGDGLVCYRVHVSYAALHVALGQ